MPLSSKPVAIALNNIHKHYQHNRVLKGIDLSIYQGEFFGLLGINGAGKSTLIGIIAGLIKADQGQCRILDYDTISDFRKARLNLGLVPQELINEPFIPIRRLLQIQCGYFGQPVDNHWIDTILQKTGLNDKANATLSSLSGGMKRRLLIAMAIVHKPHIIILDEPTAGVDINKRQQIWQFINQLHQQGHTIILTTHYLEEAETLCTRIAIINDGKIVVDQPKAAMISNHQGKRLEDIFLRYVTDNEQQTA